jgi:hypothetical protein
MGPLTHGKSLCNNGCHSGECFHINSDREIACFWNKALHVLGLDVAQNMAPKQFPGMVGMVFQVCILYAFPFSSSLV